MIRDEDDEEFLNRASEFYPLANKSFEEVYELFMRELGDGVILFLKEDFSISDNMYVGRRNKFLERDGQEFINGNGAKIETLFENCNIVTVKWCWWSDQNTVDDFFDELDPPSQHQVRFDYGIEDELLQTIAIEAFRYPDAEFFMDFIRDIDEMLYDNGTQYRCTDEFAARLRQLMEAWSRVKIGPNDDAESIVERLGVDDS
jgi:hypothetical protein